MNRARSFVGLLFLAVLAASASPGEQPGSDRASRAQVARLSAPAEPELGPLNRATESATAPFTSEPVDEARRKAASAAFEEFSGGQTATLLIGAALVAAAALFLAVVFPW